MHITYKCKVESFPLLFSPPCRDKRSFSTEGAFFVTLSHYTSRAQVVILYIIAGVMWKKISLRLYIWMGEKLLNLFQVLSSNNAREKFVLIYQMAYQAQGSPANWDVC